METQTTVQAHYRAALTPTHQETLQDVAVVGSAGSSYAPLGTERSQLLIDLYFAGYLYSWQAIFYVTKQGKEYLLQLGYSNAGYRF